MNYRRKHEKFIQVLSSASKETLIERLSSLEHNLQTPAGEEAPQSYVPLEPNFQLPNVFLKTLANNRVEKLFAENQGSTEGWNEQIDAAIEYLDELQFEGPESSGEGDPYESDVLEMLVKSRL
jgi:hypothetical protein